MQRLKGQQLDGRGPLSPSKSASTSQQTANRIWKVKSPSLPLSLSLLFLLTACSSNDFRIKAIYNAPESGFRLEVIAWGNLNTETPLGGFGEYDAHFLPLEGGEPFHFEWRYPDKDNPATHTLSLVHKNDRQVYEDGYLEDILEDTLYALGYESQQTYEVQEAIFAIYGAASGPEATVLPGQAKFLEVVDVELKHKGN
jgi:hypothetical protein